MSKSELSALTSLSPSVPSSASMSPFIPALHFADLDTIESPRTEPKIPHLHDPKAYLSPLAPSPATSFQRETTSQIHYPIPGNKSTILEPPSTLLKGEQHQPRSLTFHESSSNTRPSSPYSPARSFSASPLLLSKIREVNNASPFISRSKISPSYNRIPIEDVITLREFLKSVDLQKFGFQAPEKKTAAHYYERSHSANPVIMTTSPSGQQAFVAPHSDGHIYYKKDERTLLDYQYAISRACDENDSKNYPGAQVTSADYGAYKSSRLSTAVFVPFLEAEASKKNMKPRTISSSVKKMNYTSNGYVPYRLENQNESSSISSPTRTGHPKPIGPYKGRFGPNPICASCRTTKTPYWRDAWHQGILLCNACGLRFAKFKRRCTLCHYVPRKDDKGHRCCPMCKGSWTQ